jgi:hypothetical protein
MWMELLTIVENFNISLTYKYKWERNAVLDTGLGAALELVPM